MRTSIIFVIAMLIITCSHAQTFVNMQDSAYILLTKVVLQQVCWSTAAFPG